jgi:tetratricopeptide (TPR) repeat protein
MRNKVAAKVKQSPSKSQKKNTVTAKPKTVTMASKKPAAPPPPKPDPAFQQAVQNYETALKAFQKRDFEKAKGLLEKVLASPAKQLTDRVRMHLNVCNQQLAKTSTSFKSPEEHFDFAVAMINSGDYEGARSHLEKIVKQHPKAAYAVYGLAAVEALSRNPEEAMRNLDHAIKLDPQLRFQARNDSDFSNMADDPRFTELLYPEPQS